MRHYTIFIILCKTANQLKELFTLFFTCICPTGLERHLSDKKIHIWFSSLSVCVGRVEDLSEFGFSMVYTLSSKPARDTVRHVIPNSIQKYLLFSNFLISIYYSKWGIKQSLENQSLRNYLKIILGGRGPKRYNNCTIYFLHTSMSLVMYHWHLKSHRKIKDEWLLTLGHSQ